MKSALAALAILVAFASPSFGAAVTFQGTMTNYTTIIGASDPLGIGVPQTFVGWLNTSGSSIVNGAISFQSAPNTNFLFSGGTLATTATTTTFSNMNLIGLPGSGVLNFSFAQGIGAGLTQADVDQLRFTTGGATLAINSGGNVGFYGGSVTSVPEPASMLALSTLVAGCAGFGIRRRRAAKQALAA